MSRVTINDWRACFPFSSVRREQEEAIDFILNAFITDGKKCAIAEVGTGGGKSAIALTIARYLASLGAHVAEDASPGAYVLTTQKVLQQQYVDDFGPGVGDHKNLLLSIKSATNYACSFYPDQSCAESRRVLAQLSKRLVGTDFQKNCRANCCYASDKRAFIESPIGVTNFSYFLAETMYGKQLLPRELLVIDEAHNVQAELGKFTEVTFSEKFAKDALKCKPPKNASQEAVFEWVVKAYKPKLAKHTKALEKAIGSKYDSGAGFSEFSKQYEVLDKHACKVNRFVSSYDPENWVVNVVKPPAGSKRGMRKFEFKPIDVAPYSYDSLFRFGDRVLMMSATIVDKETFCRSVGLDPSDVAFISIPSPFSAASRLMHYLPVGSMSANNIDSTLPVLAEAVKMLLEKHSDVKGVIHSVNYRVAQYIEESVKSPRLLSHNSLNRDEVLKRHVSSVEPTVLLSPSMMEGVDLAGDASRFQVLCKVPFPYLGDQVTKKRMARDKKWYDYQTAKSVIQAMGRSVRNDTDYAVSYILDSDWERFYRSNSGMFPREFSAALA